MPTKKLFFDTDVCIRLANPAQSELLRALRKRLFPGYRLVISPATIYELYYALSKADPRYFGEHQARFRVLAETCPTLRCLPLPAAFLIRKILRRPEQPESRKPEEFEKWVRMVLQAKSRDDLLQGKVRLSDEVRRQGFDLQALQTVMDREKTSHATLLESMCDSNNPRPTPAELAIGFLAGNGYSCTPQEAVILASKLEAGYRFESALWDLAKCNTYKFDEKPSDWIDFQQLCYLADPNIHFLTDDKKTILNRVAGTAQSHQIIILAKEAQRLGLKPKTQRIRREAP